MSGILHQGGTILRTFRYPEFATEEGDEPGGQDPQEAQARRHGHHRRRRQFPRRRPSSMKEFGLPVVGVPATIDNDIPGTDISIGFDTALNIAIDAVDKVRDTATSHGRIFVIEVMGRDYGLLAAQTAIATGAEEVLLPEIPYDLDEVCRRITDGYDRGKQHAIIIVAEGAGKASYVTFEIKERLQRGVRMVVLGHVQRGGSPSGYDRILASRLGHHATEMLFDGQARRDGGHRGQQVQDQQPGQEGQGLGQGRAAGRAADGDPGLSRGLPGQKKAGSPTGSPLSLSWNGREPAATRSVALDEGVGVLEPVDLHRADHVAQALVLDLALGVLVLQVESWRTSRSGAGPCPAAGAASTRRPSVRSTISTADFVEHGVPGEVLGRGIGLHRSARSCRGHVDEVLDAGLDGLQTVALVLGQEGRPGFVDVLASSSRCRAAGRPGVSRSTAPARSRRGSV